MNSLLDNISPGDIRVDPFPHILVQDVLDPDTFRALNQSFPTYSQIVGQGSRSPPSNNRYQLSTYLVGLNPEIAEIWRAFTALHASPAFFEQVVSLFKDHWPAALTAALGGSLLGHSMGWLLRDNFETCRILQDARPEINTPVAVEKGPSVSRGAHLDMPTRLFTGLLYMRADDDDSQGGHLELFRWKDAPVHDIESDASVQRAVDVVCEIPYRANQLVMFPQGINALHGVGIRHPTPHTRRYVFISAEIAEPWLVSPTPQPY